ncbi:ATP-binding protein [Clostridium sp. MB40-C1]|uniref:ATP-binding protein n=1 Tax=Clostridium sp. MB40-C1 TaxID=3070996 RepID=UPI0027DEDF05|nr:ATP-binding protein [Clostridium sp. MB40-C1]WMJ81224.1 ATP-binding protein [Clostridium sp. MB40-C1]
MIDINHINEFETCKINVQPSNKLFKELGNITYNFVDILSELIDNSIASRVKGQLLHVNIEIGICNENKYSYIIVKDNAKGIERKSLGMAISPAERVGKSSLNEHGLGMKQAISALGDLKYIATKTKDDEKTIIVEELKFGEIVSKLFNIDWEHGTEVCVDNLKEIVPRNSVGYTKGVIKYLGARYRRYLKPERPKMKLTMKLLHIEEDNSTATKLKEWNIEDEKPIYFHPYKRKNEAVIKKGKLEGSNWEAEFTFGYAPKDEEYLEMELEIPKNYEPYTVSQSKQGFDIIINDRVINFHQLSELGLVTRHSKYNYIRGEIDLKKGFTTATTKNYIIYDLNFREVIEKIKKILLDGKYLEKRTYYDELPENLLRDRLAYHFKHRTINPIKDAKTEYAIEGLGGYIDILAQNEAWELKTTPVSGMDVYQLFAYMDMGNIEKGYMLASEFKTGAEAAKDFINKKHKKLITFVKFNEFPINHSPSEAEIKKYCNKK